MIIYSSKHTTLSFPLIIVYLRIFYNLWFSHLTKNCALEHPKNDQYNQQNIYPCLIPDSIDSFAQELHSSEVEALSIVVSFALEEPGVRLVETERKDHK